MTKSYMRKSTYLLTIIVCFTSATVSVAQENYLSYFDLINKAEGEFVINKNAEESCKLYDKAFSSYERPFVSDLYIASEIAYYSGDTIHFIKYITLCFNRGMTFQCLHNANVFSSIFSNKTLQDRLQDIYNRRAISVVDTVLRDSVYMHFYREQIIKKNMGRDQEKHSDFLKEEKKNAAYFNSFLEKGCFPSEQMIGIYTEEGRDAFLKKYNLEPFERPLPSSLSNGDKKVMALNRIPDDYELVNKTALVSYIHYPCAFANAKKEFWKAVENGYVHAKDYCMMEEWFANSITNPVYLHDCEEKKEAFYYNILPEQTVTSPELLEKVETNRAQKHIQKYSVDVAKKQLQKDKGFVFFFGFLDTR